MTKQLNAAIGKIRTNLQAKSDKVTYELLKGTRWILVRNRSDLTLEEETKLQLALNTFAELRTAYLLKEKFTLIANTIQNQPQAERFLGAWVCEAQATGLSQLVKFTQTLQNWWNEFLNYFNEGFSSAVVEGLNNAIREIIRRAYGYILFENFRLHVIVQIGFIPANLPLT